MAATPTPTLAARQSGTITTPALSALQSVANTILAVLAPTTSRLVRVAVVCDDSDDTAYTDGNLVIALPTAFCGCPLPGDTAVSVGLLAHEAGHFVQPLAAIRQVEEETGVPHWLSNILLDIHGESFVESVFPPLTEPLVATRRAVHAAHAGEYRRDLEQAASFAEAAPHAALLSRFSRSAQSFHPDWVQERPWSAKPWATAVAEFLDLLDAASELSAADLPAQLRQIIARFPELRSVPVPDLPAYGRLQADALGHILLGEAGLGSQGICPNETAELQFRRYTREAPEAEALRLAGSLRPHFEAGPGHIEVAAPGRIDRHALARGDPLPFRMRLPGKALPAPQVVLCLDISGSMAGKKLSMARVAGQSIALAVAAQGGDVVGVLFSDAAQTAVASTPSPLFAPLREWTPMGGTSFFFLPHVWRQWPEHRVLLLTDGYATPPPTLPADRQRTSAVLILEGNHRTLAGMATQTVKLADLKDLPTLLAMLIPRRR